MLARFTVLVSLLAAALPSAAQSVCSSDGLPPPVSVLERFINADCETCWQDKATPAAGRREIAIDWVLPGGKGDDAALSAVASRDALERLQALGRDAPLVSDSLRTAVRGKGPRVRVAQGVSFNDYIGTSIELKGRDKGRWGAWLLLVEALPAGTEGSPVARNLVRNVFRVPSAQAGLYESRAMQVREGAKPSRLRLVALVHDAQGRLVSAVRNECR